MFMWKNRFRKGTLPCVILLLLSVRILLELPQENKQVLLVLNISGHLSTLQSKEDKKTFSFRYQKGDEVYTGYARIKPQGNSSLQYEKKNFTVTLFQDEERTRPLALDLGWGPQNRYCLKANWIDRTHARNIVSARIIAQAQRKYGLFSQAPSGGTIDGYPIELYGKDGFWGLYTLNIPKSAWLFGQDPENPNHIAIFSEDWDDSNVFLGRPNLEQWSVVVGEESEKTMEKAYPLFDFIQNSTDETFREKLDEYLDLDGALNQYILVDFLNLGDNVAKNHCLVTYDGKKWYPSLYDLDTSWGTTIDGSGLYDYREKSINLTRNNLYARLEQCFPRELSQRYFELRQEILTKEHVMAEFASFRAEIPPEIFEKDQKRWTGSPFQSLPGYDDDQIEDYLDCVIPRLDAKYTALSLR